MHKFKIQEHSMLPTYKPGDIILASYLPYLFRSPQIGDVIIFIYEKKYMIKRIQYMDGNRYTVAGDNSTDSKDSRAFGKIAKHAIIGKVIYKQKL